jgi:hypothetical protein
MESASHRAGMLKVCTVHEIFYVVIAGHCYRSFRGAALNNRAPKRLHLGDTLCPDAGIANASSGLAEDAAPGTAHKAFDIPKGFYRYHYKLLVYTAYRNYYLP